MRRRLAPCFRAAQHQLGRGPARDEGRGDAPSTRKFLVALGSVIVVPSISLVTLTWHPRRDVSVSPKARSSMSCREYESA